MIVVSIVEIELEIYKNKEKKQMVGKQIKWKMEATTFFKSRTVFLHELEGSTDTNWTKKSGATAKSNKTHIDNISADALYLYTLKVAVLTVLKLNKF